MCTHVEVVRTDWKALHVGGVRWVQALWEALTPHFVHKIPGHDSRVILVQNAGKGVLRKQQHMSQQSMLM